jgi:hypothetical protein
MSEAREQAVRERAYVIWEREGRPAVKELAHWLQAKAEITVGKIVGVTTDHGKVVKPPARRARK